MLVRQPVLIEALVVVLSALYSLGDDSYQLKDDLSKEAWERIQQLGDISSDVETVLQQYTGEVADDCRQQLSQQNYRAGLDKKLASFRSKLEYTDKLLQSELLKCGSSEPCMKECKTKYQNDMDACLTNAKRFIVRLTKSAIKSLKEFMDSCTTGKSIHKEQEPQVTKRSDDQNQGYSELGDNGHW